MDTKRGRRKWGFTTIKALLRMDRGYMNTIRVMKEVLQERGIIFKTFLAIILIAMYQPPLMAKEKNTKNETDKIVVTDQDIKCMNVRTIIELLNQIPGVSAGEFSVELRGSYKVRVLLDGRPLNDPLSAHHAIKWDLVSLENIEKIEIYKGVGSVAFGDDTSGGVISITTKRAKGAQGNIEAFGGNFNTQNYSLSYRQDIRSFGLGLSAGWYKTDGFRTNDDKDRKRIGTKVSYSPHEGYTFDLSLDYVKEDRGIPGLPVFPTPKARSQDDTFGSSLLCNIGRLKSGTHFSHFEKEHRNPAIRLETLLKSWSLMEDLRSDFSLGKWGTINTGINLEVAHMEGNKIASRQEEKYGIYLAKDYRFKAIPLTLSGGMRWNLYSEFQEVINPEMKIGFAWRNFNLQTAFAKTNNIPTFLQRYYETSYTKPNPDLEMEKAMNYSATLSYHSEKSLEGDVAFFFNRVEDRITYVRSDSVIGRYENLGEVTIKGVEFSLKWKPGDAWEIKPSYTHLSAKDERTGKWLPAKPKHEARLDIRYRPFADLTLALNTKYVSRQYTRSDNKESVPGYFGAGLRAEYYLKKVRVFLKIENLFDKKYFYGDGYPAPPLSWYAGLNYEF